MPNSSEKNLASFSFPSVERSVFERNYLHTVVIELRFPTFLRLKEKEPIEISESIRQRFPIYEPAKEIEVTALGTTDPQPMYKFTTRSRDPVLSISTSKLALVTKNYKSFDDFISHVDYLINSAIPYVETTFFTRIGLRYINNVSGFKEGGLDVVDWINEDLIRPVGRRALGAIHVLENKLAGSLENGGGYTFRYGLSPPTEENRKFVLDWDYFREDVEVCDCIQLLKTFHNLHFPFFWWALGNKAREALKDGTART